MTMLITKFSKHPVKNGHLAAFKTHKTGFRMTGHDFQKNMDFVILGSKGYFGAI